MCSGMRSKIRIEFERHGGFTGIPLVLQVSENDLEPELLDQIQAEIDRADFFNLPTIIGDPNTPDRFRYRLTVALPGLEHSVESGESHLPAELQPLVQHLANLARSQR